MLKSPKSIFLEKFIAEQEMDMITAFSWGIRGSEGEMIVHAATRVRYELVQF